MYKKMMAFLLAAFLMVSSAGCAAQTSETAETAGEKVELIVFAAASMTETIDQIAEMYQEVAPNVTLQCNYDSSGTLKTQIQEGADCDIFISAGQLQMDQLDQEASPEVNTEGLDFVDGSTRCNLVQNICVLTVPEGNPKGIESFDDVATDKVEMIALGNSDVPVGQYAEQIFTTLGVWEEIQPKITFATNVKEVTTQVEQAAVDCGVVYGTDAYSAGLEAVCTAPEGSHDDVVYPAAVMKTSKHPEEAAAFLEYLKTEDCTKVFESVGFAIPE